MKRVALQSIWAVALAGVAWLATWACFGFEWPVEQGWTFYAPYSLYTVDPWAIAVDVFVILVGVRVFVVRRRSRAAHRIRQGE